MFPREHWQAALEGQGRFALSAGWWYEWATGVLSLMRLKITYDVHAT